MSLNRSVYLCGQITGLSFEEAKYGWRRKVAASLAGDDIQCLSPMRGKREPGLESQGMTEEGLSPMGDPDSILSCARGITARDHFDVQHCGVLFCNLLGMQRVSVGSMIEFGWASAYRKPIVCCMEEEEGNPHWHGMTISLIDFHCTTLEEGIQVVRAIFQRGL